LKWLEWRCLAFRKEDWNKKMKKHLTLHWIIISLLLFGSFLAVPPQTALAALGITSVQPNVVSNTTSVDLVITGTDFIDGAVVVLENFGGLQTSFVSATVLTATMPAGLPTGSYGITVINPDSTSAFLANGVQIVQASQTPQDIGSEVTPTPYSRPLVIIESYNMSVDKITPGQNFNLVVKLKNSGQREATNVVATFATGTLVPRETGGVVAVKELDPGETRKVEQPFTATYDLWGSTVASQTMSLTYTDASGTTYTENFTLSLPVIGYSGVAGPTSTPTPTPTVLARPRPQLVIGAYQTDLEILTPGSRFSLDLTINNVGNADAKRITMILGGGSSGSTNPDGTAVPGGVSGSSGDFGNFAPVASSNVQFLGDLTAGSTLPANAQLIVNATANPGAYPMKISYVYTGPDNISYTDDQVITLLVFSIPQLEVSFYRDAGQFFVGQPNQIPLQVVNLGRKQAVLGSMRVSARPAEGMPGAQLMNNTTLIGALDPGGYYTLDATLIPEAAGPLDLIVSLDYTDDFNQAQVITRTISVVIEEMMVGPDGGIPPDGGFPPDGGEFPDGGFPEPSQPETIGQKILRFLRGLLGLDSAQPSGGEEFMPPMEMPEGGSEEAVPVAPPIKG